MIAAEIPDLAFSDTLITWIVVVFGGGGLAVKLLTRDWTSTDRASDSLEKGWSRGFEAGQESRDPAIDDLKVQIAQLRSEVEHMRAGREVQRVEHREEMEGMKTDLQKALDVRDVMIRGLRDSLREFRQIISDLTDIVHPDHDDRVKSILKRVISIDPDASS